VPGRGLSRLQPDPVVHQLADGCRVRCRITSSLLGDL
jgi:hypothetical protein